MKKELVIGTPKWIFWAGLAAIIGGTQAILFTAPFATAYFRAYPGFDVPPFWLQSAKSALLPLLDFASPIDAYNIYGRIYNFVFLLYLPAVFALHHLHQVANSRKEMWGFATLVVGLLVTFIGVAGDYWADGAGFLFSIFGLFILSIGTTLYGIATLQGKILPRWVGWLLVSCLPGVFIFTSLIGHLPSGPSFPFAVSWLILGYMLLFKKGLRPRLDK